eukprot:TRINITY_DN4084_c0_g1_i1.p1 TRINITY_DN4084_c0_g1~~TRINITY_DN4084_c0_g1_i1.p1  ORF type:complete len:338 (-),score=82.88 TRINITY_DN4084_c0_g1_i1:336-1349(-)
MTAQLRALWLIPLIAILFQWTVTESVQLSSSSVQQQGRVIIYQDYRINWAHPELDIKTAVDNGFTHILLSFWMSYGPADAAQAWVSVDPAVRNATLKYVHSKGAKLMVSIGGGTENVGGFITNNSPTGASYGTKAADWAKAYGLDGVDFDLELPPGDSSLFRNGKAIDWIANATLSARLVLGSSAIISHAPQAPYLSPWAGDQRGYIEIYNRVGDSIDFFNIQFYNQGASTPYDTFQTLFLNSGSSLPQSSLMEIAKAGNIPLSKLVVGKYICPGCGGSGFVPTDSLAQLLAQAVQQLQWKAGAMGWMWMTGDQSVLDWGNKMRAVFSPSHNILTAK